jgi:bifunctional enzyme CysN/CysC
MERASPPLESNIHAYLLQHAQKGLLRFITCGSVDDGKSSLIGRLLWESKVLFEDQLATLQADSKRLGTRGEEIDYALLLDGLSAEREQGITIDVAYRYFSTDQRQFIVADTPGHEQYTRNMVTGASTADLAIILVDSRKGLLAQTRRHSLLVNLIGIRHVVLAVNKMDLVGYSQARFEQIESDYRAFATQIGIQHIMAIPISAIHGDNLTKDSAQTPWYSGPCLMQHLEQVEVDTQRLEAQPFRMPVQWVNRPHHDFRGYTGTLASGSVKPGDRIRVSPSGVQSTVARIVTFDGDLNTAVAHQSITLTLADEVDISRGDVIALADSPAPSAQQFEATLVWMGEQAMLPGRDYLMKIGTRTVTASVMPLKYKIDINTGGHLPATLLTLNEIGVVGLKLDRPIAFDPYEVNRNMGGFILIDRISNDTVGAGMIRHSLRRDDNIHWQALEVNKASRRRVNQHGSAVVWLTGLSGAGKSTLANLLEKRLHAMGKRTYLLDGDNVRHGLTKDLGFTAADRVENIRRVAEVAKLFVDAGIIVLTAFISPFRSERRMARDLMDSGEFIEVFVDTPMTVAESRDPKGLYRKARRGELKNFTGIDSPYETPEAPEIRVDTSLSSPEDAVDQIYQYLLDMGLLGEA